MPNSQRIDVLVDVTPNLTVFRQGGVWHWRGGPKTTQEDVLRELAAQVDRMHLKHGLLAEALQGLRSGLQTNPP